MKRLLSASLVILLAVSQFVWAAHACPLSSVDQSAESTVIASVQVADIDDDIHEDERADHDVDQCDICNATMAATAQNPTFVGEAFAHTESGFVAALPPGAPERLQSRPPILPAV